MRCKNRCSTFYTQIACLLILAPKTIFRNSLKNYILSELHQLDLKLCSKQSYKTDLLHRIVVPQQSGGCWHNYSSKTRQAGCANEQFTYSQLSMPKNGVYSYPKFTFLGSLVRVTTMVMFHLVHSLFVYRKSWLILLSKIWLF